MAAEKRDEGNNREICGYVANFINPIDEAFKCVICHEVLREPIQIIPCGHRYCKVCLTNYIRASNGEATCPMDRSPICEEKMFPDNGFNRMILNFEVACHNSECVWKSTLSQLETHLADECIYVETSCPNDGCFQKMQKRFVEEHKNHDCQQRIVQCDFCLKDYTALEIQKHQEDDCPFFLISCLNNGCTSSIKRCELQSHIEGECRFAPQDCPLKFLGCEIKGIRSLIDKHVKQEAHNHLRLVCEELKSSKSSYEGRLNNLQTEMQSLKDQMQKLMGISPKTSRDALEDIKKETEQQLQSNVAEVNNEPSMKIISCNWNVRGAKLDFEKISPIFEIGERGYHFRLCYCYPGFSRSRGIKIKMERCKGKNDELLPKTFSRDAELKIQNPATASTAAKPHIFHRFQFKLLNEYRCWMRFLKITKETARNSRIENFDDVDIELSLHIPSDHPALGQG